MDLANQQPPEGDDVVPAPVTKYEKIIESPDDSKGSLTFGIEIEFVVPILRSGVPDPFPSDRRPVFKYPDYSNASGLIFYELRKVCDIPFRLDTNDSYYEPHRKVVRYDTWRIVRDPSVKYKGTRGEYSWAGREITSEVFKSDNPQHYTEQITKACRALRQLRVHLNQTTSLHVHVGLGDEPFSLLTIKKVIALILVADAMLLGLHHPARLDSPYCKLVSRCSSLGRWTSPLSQAQKESMRKPITASMARFIPDITATTDQVLQETESLEELARVMNDPDYYGYFRGTVSFARFLPEDGIGGNTQTIEFRQMEGCLDPDHIIHWAKVCMAIVDFARLAEPEKYKDLMEKLMVEEIPFSVFDLLLYLGLEKEEKFFRGKVKRYESNVDFYEGEGSGGLFVPEMK
ncbi:putative amidoligase enzyme-domain-containing protein [Rostrohypoxylon terebratum]|nr:putative amidoligase enzyme-domain-containing protein [Rostrohypoxylon terebratum]